ncbi:MAG: trypsin-like peptidase domain-containing protein [Planctomycetota bacterium]
MRNNKHRKAVIIRRLARRLSGAIIRIKSASLLLFITGLIAVWAIMEIQINSLVNLSEEFQNNQLSQQKALSDANEQIRASDDTAMALRQRINIILKQTEIESQMTKDEVASLRKGLTNFLKEISSADEKVSNKLGVIEKQLNATTDRLVNNLDDVSRLKQSLNNSVRNERLYEELLLPSVRIRTKGNVGSGVVIYSQPYLKNECQTYILTAYHVVKGADGSISDDPSDVSIKKPADKKASEITIDVYRDDFSDMDELKAEMVIYDEAKDIAILHLKVSKQFKHTAHFISKDRIDQVKVFSPVYAVGCPLGYDPLPTSGEISSLYKQMNGEKFWVMSAPTIFGNSGGGVFMGDTYDLIGISSMVCVYNQIIPTPVTHLGLMVPAETIFEWMDRKGLEFLHNPGIKAVPFEGLTMNQAGNTD